MKEGYVAGDVDASGLRLAIVASRFHREIVDRLVAGAVEALVDAGADESDIDVCWVPGAFEIPLVLRHHAATGRYDCLVAVGAVIRGETPHFDLIAGEATRGCGAVAREFGLPIGFGIITTEDRAQADERAGGAHGNKGQEAALAAVETARLLGQLRPSGPADDFGHL